MRSALALASRHKILRMLDPRTLEIESYRYSGKMIRIVVGITALLHLIGEHTVCVTNIIMFCSYHALIIIIMSLVHVAMVLYCITLY